MHAFDVYIYILVAIFDRGDVFVCDLGFHSRNVACMNTRKRSNAKKGHFLTLKRFFFFVSLRFRSVLLVVGRFGRGFVRRDLDETVEAYCLRLFIDERALFADSFDD